MTWRNLLKDDDDEDEDNINLEEVSVLVVTGTENSIDTVIEAQGVVDVVVSVMLSVSTTEESISTLASNLSKNWVLALVGVLVENLSLWTFALPVVGVVDLSVRAANNWVERLAVILVVLLVTAEGNVVSVVVALRLALAEGNDIEDA